MMLIDKLIGKIISWIVVLLLIGNLLVDGEEKLPLLHPIFSDSMVIQRDHPIRIWGWYQPSQAITIQLGDHQSNVVVQEDGRWEVVFPPISAGGPYTLEVRTPNEKRIVKDILVGDVWICSGQSNMTMGVGSALNGKEEASRADYPSIRLLTVPRKIGLIPQLITRLSWKICNPKTILEDGWGGFSAVGYFFGREIHTATHVPIGLIESNWGGTPAQAWTRLEALQKVPEMESTVTVFKKQVTEFLTSPLDLSTRRQQWFIENDPGTIRKLFQPKEQDQVEWKDYPTQPIPWEKTWVGQFDGVIWFRLSFQLTPEQSERQATLYLSKIDDIDDTWINGIYIGGMDEWDKNRSYTIAPGILRPGKNLLTIRIVDTGGQGGLYGDPNQLYLQVGEEKVNLQEGWQCYVSIPLSQCSTSFPSDLGKKPYLPSVLYNGMIHPLTPFPIRGVIWYQGEADAGRASLYEKILPAMIQDWRERFQCGDFPFYQVQLANFMAVQQKPDEGGWAWIRESQFVIAQQVPNCGIATAIDIGEAEDIHPRNKQEVGRRLALIALAKVYGKDVEYSGPIYERMEKEGNKIRLFFSHIGKGLVCKGEKLQGFGIAGADRKFVFGEAVIENNTVVVWSPEIEDPQFVYYGWANNPIGNLYNRDGLPAFPFRTDRPYSVNK